jgi:hypothetical protein
MSQVIRSTEERFKDFIERHHICGVSEIVDNNSKIYGGNCYKTVLSRENSQVTVYSFSNPNIYQQSLTDVLWFVATNANSDGYLESYRRWKQENDYDGMLSREEQRAMYAYNRQCHKKLMSFLGLELYEELALIERS